MIQVLREVLAGHEVAVTHVERAVDLELRLLVDGEVLVDDPDAAGQ